MPESLWIPYKGVVSVWHALPFDDLKYYQALGYHVDMGLILIAVAIGLILGMTVGSNVSNTGDSFGFGVIAVVFSIPFLFIMENGKSDALRYQYLNPDKFAQAQIGYLLIDSCLVACLATYLVVSTTFEFIRWLFRDI